MGLVRAFECDDYRPEYGLLLLHDMAEPDGLGAGDLPRGHGDGTSPTGTFAGAGAGWVAAQARDADQMVRLELHHGPPDSDAEFDDVLETPYYAGSGSLALSTLTGGPAGQDEFDLGDAVRYRVRVARRADTWLLRFWPDPALDPPVWFARSSAAVRAGGDGWHSELPHMLMQVAAVAGNLARGEHGGWATEDQLDRWWRTHGPMAGLDEPLWPEPPERPTTGHADLDQRNADQRARALAQQDKERDRLDEIAAELGVPPVRRRRDGLPLLVVAGLLLHEEPDRYRTGRPAPVDTVLTLPPDRVRQLRQSDNRRFHRLAEDVTAVLRWAPELPLETTAGPLAARLLVDEADLRGAIAHAAETGLLHTESEEPLRMFLGPPPREPAERAARDLPDADEPAALLFQPAAAGRPDADELTTHFVRVFPTTGTSSRPKPVLPPFGPPPRAGAIESDGIVVTWHDGERRELARLGTREWHSRRWSRALQTRHGILAIRHGRPARLVSASGEVTEIAEIGTLGVSLLGDGRHVAHHEREHDRSSTRHRIRVIDLAGGPSTTLPWPEDRDILMLGACGDSVYFADEAPSVLSAQERVTMRWTPGTDPRPHPHRFMHIDRLTGITSRPATGGITVARPDGATVHVPIDTQARLAPGGGRLWTVRNHPPALTLFPVEPDPQAQVLWLPHDGRTSANGTYEMTPTWEDPDHVLFAYEPDHRRPEPATGVRLSLRDGSAERLPAAGRARSVLFVEPLLTP